MTLGCGETGLLEQNVPSSLPLLSSSSRSPSSVARCTIFQEETRFHASLWNLKNTEQVNKHVWWLDNSSVLCLTPIMGSARISVRCRNKEKVFEGTRTVWPGEGAESYFKYLLVIWCKRDLAASVCFQKAERGLVSESCKKADFYSTDGSTNI